MRNRYTVSENKRNMSIEQVADKTLITFDKGRYGIQFDTNVLARMIAKTYEDDSFINAYIEYKGKENLKKILQG